MRFAGDQKTALTGESLYVLQQFDKFWIWKKKNFAAIWQKDTLTLDGLEKEQLIQLDDVTRIKLALRTQGQLAPFVCCLDFKIGNFAFDITEIIWAKKISVKLQ